MSSIKALPTTDPYANVGRVDRSFSSPAQLLLARQMAEESQAAEDERKASQEEGSTEHFSKRSAKPALQRFDTRALIKQVVTDPEAHFTSLELEDVREKFKLFDADGSGDLSVEELDVAVRYMVRKIVLLSFARKGFRQTRLSHKQTFNEPRDTTQRRRSLSQRCLLWTPTALASLTSKSFSAFC